MRGHWVMSFDTPRRSSSESNASTQYVCCAGVPRHLTPLSKRRKPSTYRSKWGQINRAHSGAGTALQSFGVSLPAEHVPGRSPSPKRKTSIGSGLRRLCPFAFDRGVILSRVFRPSRTDWGCELRRPGVQK